MKREQRDIKRNQFNVKFQLERKIINVGRAQREEEKTQRRRKLKGKKERKKERKKKRKDEYRRSTQRERISPLKFCTLPLSGKENGFVTSKSAFPLDAFLPPPFHHLFPSLCDSLTFRLLLSNSFVRHVRTYRRYICIFRASRLRLNLHERRIRNLVSEVSYIRA